MDPLIGRADTVAAGALGESSAAKLLFAIRRRISRAWRASSKRWV